VNNLVETMAEREDSDSESGAKKYAYGTLFSQMESATSTFFEAHLEHVKFFPEIIANLEAKAVLVSLNVNFMACVEVFLIEIFRMSTRVSSQCGSSFYRAGI
jgi:hypothetical protein